MAKKKQKIITKTVVKKYITKSVEFEVDSFIGDPENGSRVTLVGTFIPEDKTIKLDHIHQLSERPFKLEKVLALAQALTNLVDEITRKEHLRELAEGFGESIESHKSKK